MSVLPNFVNLVRYDNNNEANRDTANPAQGKIALPVIWGKLVW